MFRFRLDPVLRLRERHRDLVRATLAEALRLRELVAARERAHADEVASGQAALRDATAAGGVDVQTTLELRAYLGRLRIERAELDRSAALADEQVAVCRRALTEADRRVRTLEILRDKQRDAYRRDERRREDRDATDVWTAARRFATEPSGVSP
ncbi:MAG: flagellar export protein FliJ [Planctomycetota bacterium]